MKSMYKWTQFIGIYECDVRVLQCTGVQIRHMNTALSHAIVVRIYKARLFQMST